MSNKKYFFISIITLIFGIFVYALYNEIIIIRIPKKNNYIVNNESNTKKKQIYLYFWKDNKWNLEQKEVIFNQIKSENLAYLINTWLNVFTEEKNYKKIILQSVLLDSNGVEAFISFDKSPFLKENSTYDKLLWVESLLKTLSVNGIPIQSIRFLVSHKPLQDFHLDFSKSWPLSGFINNKS